MADGTEESTTRSGKKMAPYNKRKRSVEEVQSHSSSKKKMGGDEDSISAQLEAMKTFLGDKIENSVKAVTDRLNATEADLALHKATTQYELQYVLASAI